MCFAVPKRSGPDFQAERRGQTDQELCHYHQGAQQDDCHEHGSKTNNDNHTPSTAISGLTRRFESELYFVFPLPDGKSQFLEEIVIRVRRICQMLQKPHE